MASVVTPPERIKDRPEPKSWEHQIAQQVGEAIEHYRRKRDLTAAQLAERVWGPGQPPGRRMVIVNLENGRREAVSVAEVLAIASALRVPPLVLVLPVGREGAVLLGPNLAAPTPKAVEWFVGDLDGPNGTRRPSRDELGQDELLDAVEYSRRYRQIEELHRGLSAVRERMAEDPESLTGYSLADTERTLAEAKRALRDMRRIMSAKGQALPWLPDYLADLDEDDDREAAP